MSNLSDRQEIWIRIVESRISENLKSLGWGASTSIAIEIADKVLEEYDKKFKTEKTND